MFNERGKPTFCMLKCPIDFFLKQLSSSFPVFLLQIASSFGKAFWCRLLYFRESGNDRKYE